MADNEKIARHYSGTWTGKVDRSKAPDFTPHNDHPKSTTKQMEKKSG